MDDEQFDIWLAQQIGMERSWRANHGQVNANDPDDLIAEFVMQELLRDAIFDVSQFLTWCARQVVRKDPKFQADYDSLQRMEDASDEFFDLHAKEMAARLNEVSKDLSYRRNPPAQPEDDDSL